MSAPVKRLSGGQKHSKGATGCDRTLRDRCGLLVGVLGEEEQARHTHLLNVQADKDVVDRLGVEQSTGLARLGGVDDEEEEVLKLR